MPDPTNWYTMQLPLADISTASSVRFLVPTAGFIRRVGCTIANAITVADSVLTVSKNNSALSPTITVAFTGSAEGDYDEAEYYTGVAKGDWVEVATDGGSTTTAVATISLTLSA
jgi:hypothetical protein